MVLLAFYQSETLMMMDSLQDVSVKDVCILSTCYWLLVRIQELFDDGENVLCCNPDITFLHIIDGFNVSAVSIYKYCAKKKTLHPAPPWREGSR